MTIGAFVATRAAMTSMSTPARDVGHEQDQAPVEAVGDDARRDRQEDVGQARATRPDAEGPAE